MKGFDTRLGRKKQSLLSGEETQFQHRLKALGGRLYYHPSVLIHHFVPMERAAPNFFYKRYYWGGITDFIMSRTLHGLPFEHINQQSEKSSRISRLMSHSLMSLGMGISEGQKIQGRIYMSYVAGQLVATLKYGWRNLDR